jgi:hypothetical protein
VRSTCGKQERYSINEPAFVSLSHAACIMVQCKRMEFRVSAERNSQSERAMTVVPLEPILANLLGRNCLSTTIDENTRP